MMMVDYIDYMIFKRLCFWKVVTHVLNKSILKAFYVHDPVLGVEDTVLNLTKILFS